MRKMKFAQVTGGVFGNLVDTLNPALSGFIAFDLAACEFATLENKSWQWAEM